MARSAVQTKVMINGIDVSPYLYRCNLPRFPEAMETVELTMEISELEVESDGTLVIHINTED